MHCLRDPDPRPGGKEEPVGVKTEGFKLKNLDKIGSQIIIDEVSEICPP